MINRYIEQINNLFEVLSTKTEIPPDKLKHLAVGLLGGLIFIPLHTWGGFIFVTLVLAGKEVIWDWKMKEGTPEIMDFLFGFIPLCVILGIKLLISW